MKSIFSTLFRGDVFEKGAEIVDEAFHTDQEKAQHSEKILFIKKKLLELYEPFKVAQRYLALIFSIPFVVLHTGAFSLRIAYWDNKLLQTSVQTIQVDINESLGLIVLTIVGFYFFCGATEGGIRAWKGNVTK